MKISILMSIPFLTLLLSNRFPEKHIIIGCLFSFLISLYLILKKVKISKINLHLLFISGFISIYMINHFMDYSYTNIQFIQRIFNIHFNIGLSFSLINKFVGLLSMPGLTFIVYVFVIKAKKFIVDEYKLITKIEKKYLLIIFIIAIILSSFITTFSTAFTMPTYKENIQLYDVIYTSDTGSLVSGNAYFNVSHQENDIRQPLFGIMSLPFSVPVMFLDEFLLPHFNGYQMMLTIVQFLLIAITTILLARLLNLNKSEKKYFYLLFSVSYPYLLFSLVLEQYAIGLFWLILTIYIYYKKKESINYAFIGAVGTMITSGIFFPLISKFKSSKQWIKNVFKCFLAFMAILIIGGQFSQILTARERFLWLTTSFSGKISFVDKLLQFFNFIRGIFFAPLGKVEMMGNHMAYKLVLTDCISIIGVVILIYSLIGFYINRKNTMARISLFWIIFSFIVLCVVGWGAQENGMILYSLYFSWAYLILIFKFFQSISINRKMYNIIFGIFILIMFVWNFYELCNIISFAIKYY